jgi:predicted glycogen debranching enzyme
MGTVSGLRTRRYHGLQVVSSSAPGQRHLGLCALDPMLIVSDRRIPLAVNEWASGAVDPQGQLLLSHFAVEDGVPRWTWDVGDILLERELAMQRGRPVVGIRFRLRRSPVPVRLVLSALCTWRDANANRWGNETPDTQLVAGGFTFEGAYRVEGPGFASDGTWYRGAHYREEARRGLNPDEDLWHAGTFTASLQPGDTMQVLCWADDPTLLPPPAAEIIDLARERARAVREAMPARDGVAGTLTQAADQVIAAGPTVIAGYPWFGEWSRDTMTAYEGLFLRTGRSAEGRRLLLRAGETVSEGMLANTTDLGDPQYNTIDATLWFVHAVGRHVDATDDTDLAAELLPRLKEIVDWQVRGTRYDIRVDPEDGLLCGGQPGVALTWMDARIDGEPVTQRAGKPVEVNALWINALATIGMLADRLREDCGPVRAMEGQARRAFRERFLHDGRCLDVVDGPGGDQAELRPNCLLAVSLPFAPLAERSIVEACAASLLTSLGLRSLAPGAPAYTGRHQGTQAERDRAYHQGTVWPWLIGPYVEAAIKTGVSTEGVLEGLDAHLSEWGIGSVSETADGDPPHLATGCPFQAWSVAELIRAHALLQPR